MACMRTFLMALQIIMLMMGIYSHYSSTIPLYIVVKLLFLDIKLSDILALSHTQVEKNTTVNKTCIENNLLYTAVHKKKYFIYTSFYFCLYCTDYYYCFSLASGSSLNSHSFILITYYLKNIYKYLPYK